MKPNFALSLTDDSIGLLHRTARGWLEIGATSLDAPDLAEALSYLRRSALGLAPHGVATKVVIPNSQILYTEVAAPGPTDVDRDLQIRRALEGRTPYAVDDLVFDWSGDDHIVQVAVVARETLDEAEAFATQYRLNPISFVAVPDPAQFAGEPWFGPSALAASLLADGDHVERDSEALTVISREAGRGDRPAEPEPSAVSFGPAEDPLMPEAEPELPTAEMEPPVQADLPLEPPPRAAGPEVIPPVHAPPRQPVAPDPVLAAPVSPEPVAPEPVAKAPAVRPEPPQSDPAPLPASDPEYPIEAPPAFASRRAAEPAAEPTLRAPEPKPESGLPAEPQAAGAEAASVRLAVTSVTSHGRKAPAAPLTPPATGPARAEPQPYQPELMDEAVDETFADLMAEPQIEDDLPPAPPASVQAARARGAAPLAAPARNPARPAAAPKPAKGKALGGIVTAPGIPGFGGPKKAKPNPAAAAETLVAPPPPAEQRPFRVQRPAPKGKPKFLGLILTGLLLIALAVLAAWSSIYLAGGSDPEDQTEVAALAPEAPAPEAASPDPSAAPAPASQPLAPEDLPLPEDEAAADGVILPEDEAAADGIASADAAPPEAPVSEAAAEARLQSGATALPGVADEIVIAAMDQPPAALPAQQLGVPQLAADAQPSGAALPPPFGTQYEFDDNGLIKPTPEGILSPDGVLLVAGPPPKRPPERPASLVPLAAAPAPALDADNPPPAADPTLQGRRPAPRPASIATLAAPAATPAVSDNPPPAADPTLQDRRPEPRPASIAALALPSVAPAATDDPPPAADPALQGLRPPVRPEGLVANDDAALDIPAETRFASKVPRRRPAEITAQAEQRRLDEEARKVAEAASLSAAAAARALAEAAPQGEPAALKPEGPFSELAVSISRRPEPRPRNFDRKVAAAVASAAIRPREEPREKPDAPEDKPRRAEPGEDEEPDVAPARTPKVPTKGSVAKNATFANAIDLGKTNLIGVYGTPSRRHALVRLGSGQYKKVKVGDRVDGGTVAAITESEVRYKKGGRMITLKMPKT